MARIKLVSIAESVRDQQQGLQFVRHMPEDSGMLFRFNSPRILSFWGINTYLDLDIAFIDSEGTIVKTSRIVPLSMRSVSSEKPCTMALEVVAGTLERMGIRAGAKTTLMDNEVEIQ